MRTITLKILFLFSIQVSKNNMILTVFMSLIKKLGGDIIVMMDVNHDYYIKDQKIRPRKKYY